MTWDQQRIQDHIDNRVEENVGLDYKAAGAIDKSPKKKIEITKDVSAFANSAGGTIIYGVQEFGTKEKQHLPEKITPIDRRQYSKEWLEQIINNIRPRIPKVTIHPVEIDGSSNDVVYVVEVEQSVTVHQAQDHRYYKRFNFESRPMEDYEVQDVRNRNAKYTPLVRFDVSIKNMTVYLTISNPGTAIAQDVKFNFLKPLSWDEGREIPPLFQDGATVIAPGESHRYRYTNAGMINLDDDELEVEISYYHPEVGKRVTDSYHTAFRNYGGSTVEHSEIERLGGQLESSVADLTHQVKQLNKKLDNLCSVAGATGLHISIPSIRNMQYLLGSGNGFHKLDPVRKNAKFFVEVLEVDWDLADRLDGYFWNKMDGSGLREIEGMTEDIIKKIHERLIC